VKGGQRIEVFNRGGKVVCATRITDGDIVTTLEGNATFEWMGEAHFDGDVLRYDVVEHTSEAEYWHKFVESLN
jgi:hypothetical protein